MPQRSESKKATAIKQRKGLAFGIALGFFCLHLAVVGIISFTPTDGLEGMLTADGFYVRESILPSLADTIRAGDLVTSIDGYEISNSSSYWLEAEIYADRPQSGEAHVYTLVREGQTSDVPVQLETIGIPAYMQHHWLNFMTFIVYMVIALLVVIRKPLHRASWIYYLLMLVASVPLTSRSAYLSFEGAAFMRSLMTMLSRISFGGAGLLFFLFSLEFPSPVYNRRRETVLYRLWGSISFFLLVAITMTSLTHPLAGSFFACSIACYVPATLVLLGICSMGWAYYHEKQAVKRAQLRWLFWGLFLAMVSAGVAVVLQPSHAVRLEGAVFFISGTFFFSAGAIALIRYKLFLIDTLTQKAVAFAFSSFLVLGVYSGSYVFLQLLFRDLSHLSSLEPAALISILVAVSVTGLARRILREQFSQRFHLYPVDAESLLTYLSEQLAVGATHTRIRELMLGEVPEKLAIRQAWLYTYSVSADELQLLNQDGDSRNATAMTAALHHFLFAGEALKQLYHINPSDMSPEETVLAQHGVEIIIPVYFEKEMVGLYLLSGKLGQKNYTPAELRLLDEIRYQLAFALHNAATYQQILKDRQSMAGVIQSISEGVIVFDKRGEISLRNQVADRMFEGKKSMLVGKNFLGAFLVTDTEASTEKSEAFYEATAKGKRYQGNHWICRRKFAEKPLPASLTCSPLLNADGIIIGSVLTIHDRTEELQLLDTKDSFIATVGHELRTPMLLLNNYIAELREVKNPEEVADTIGILEKTAHRLADRIQQIIKISELQHKEDGLTLSAIDIMAIMAQLDVHYRQRAPEGVRFMIDNQTELASVFITANEKAVMTVCTVLLDNAFDATSEGQVMVRLQYRAGGKQGKQVVLPQEATHLLVEIADTGKGIEPAFLEHMFEPFTQVGGALGRDERKGGLGLGLYLVSLLVKQMHGDVWCMSTIGRGTSFFCSLPIVNEQTDDSIRNDNGYLA
ncbi:MAG TPA: ATP-binding protein [bacterium]|nr:ATP-binding protein [bacterium]